MSNDNLKKLQKLSKLGKLAILAGKLDEDEKKKKKRRWVRDWVARRQTEVPLFLEIQDEDPEKFFTNFRLNPQDFYQLLHR